MAVGERAFRKPARSLARRRDGVPQQLHHRLSFSLQTLALARDGEWTRAGGNVVLSLVLCLAAAAGGALAAHVLFAAGAA